MSSKGSEVSLRDDSAMDFEVNPETARRLQAISDVNTGMLVYEDYGGNPGDRDDGGLLPLDHPGGPYNMTAEKSRMMLPSFSQPQQQLAIASQGVTDTLDRGRRNRSHPALQDDLASVRGSELVVRKALDAYDEQALLQRHTEDAANTQPDMDNIVELHQLQSYFERNQSEDVHNAASDNELSSADEKEKDILEAEKYMQDQMLSYIKRSGGARLSNQVTDKMDDFWKTTGRKEQLIQPTSRYGRGPRGGAILPTKNLGDNSFEMGGMSGATNRMTPGAQSQRGSLLSPFEESKDFPTYTQYTSRTSGTSRGIRTESAGDDSVSSNFATGSGNVAGQAVQTHVHEYNKVVFPEVVAKSLTMAEDVQDFDKMDAAYALLKEEGCLFQHIQESMREDGHRLHVEDTLEKARKSQMEKRHMHHKVATNDETYMFGDDEGGDGGAYSSVRKEEHDEDDPMSKPEHNVHDIHQLGHLVATSVRSLQNNLEPHHFRRASQHLNDRQTGVEKAVSKRHHRGSRR